jgi:biopolymer transport protein ExbB
MVTLFGTSDPRFLAGGISEALITTEAGLFIAIPSLLMRGILGSVAEAALGRLESGALSVVIALVKGQKPRESIAEAVA